MHVVQFFAYIVVSGIHGGVHVISNTEEALPQLWRLHAGSILNIRNMGALLVNDVEVITHFELGHESRYLYIKVTPYVEIIKV